MRKRTMLVVMVLVLAAAYCVNAYAADAGAATGWENFWNGVGGFFYNALPWNWGNWVGK